ncbi:MAG: c-type cytochrome [Candidatus Acidiferrales bacterium]
MPHFATARRNGLQLEILILAGLFLALSGRAYPQDKQDTHDAQAKKEPVKQAAPLTGAGMFKDYCAVCHGKDGKGDGPAAPALKQTPANLTTLAKRHGGKFPDLYVQQVLRNGAKAPAHGDAEMPVWGPLFRSMDADPAIMYVRISSLVNYIKSLQVK